MHSPRDDAENLVVRILHEGDLLVWEALRTFVSVRSAQARFISAGKLTDLFRGEKVGQVDVSPSVGAVNVSSSITVLKSGNVGLVVDASIVVSIGW